MGAFGDAHAQWAEGVKRIALRPDYLRARPERLRFQIFCSPGCRSATFICFDNGSIFRYRVA
jgi:hypothetical protein